MSSSPVSLPFSVLFYVPRKTKDGRHWQGTRRERHFFPAASLFLPNSLPEVVVILASMAPAPRGHQNLCPLTREVVASSYYCCSLEAWPFVHSRNTAYPPVSIPFIKISVWNHPSEFCFLLGPWPVGWVYKVLHNLTSAYLAHRSLCIPAVI